MVPALVPDPLFLQVQHLEQVFTDVAIANTLLRLQFGYSKDASVEESIYTVAKQTFVNHVVSDQYLATETTHDKILSNASHCKGVRVRAWTLDPELKPC